MVTEFIIPLVEYRCNNKFRYQVTSCWLLLLSHTTMHGSMNIKFINAKEATEIHAYKNTKRKLYKTNAAIWFNKTCRDKQLTPNYININPLKPELNPICYLMSLLGAHHFLHVSRIRVKLLTFRLLMSYIWSTYS